jgi:hypothetical protein
VISNDVHLDQEICHQKAAECHRLASEASSPSVQIMLDHIAETWLRIGRNLSE